VRRISPAVTIGGRRLLSWCTSSTSLGLASAYDLRPSAFPVFAFLRSRAPRSFATRVARSDNRFTQLDESAEILRLSSQPDPFHIAQTRAGGAGDDFRAGSIPPLRSRGCGGMKAARM